MIKAMREEFSKMRQLLVSKDSEIASLKDKVSSLQTEIIKIKETIDDENAYERRDTVIFSGNSIPESSSGEDCISIVTNLLKNKLRMEVNPSEFSTSHRLGRKPPPQQPDRRSIIAKFCRRDKKREILANCRSSRPTDFYANESLTPIRSTILYVLRKMKREPNSRLTSCSTKDGKVYAYVKTSPNAPPSARPTGMLINSYEKLREFSTTTMGKELSTYIETWPH